MLHPDFDPLARQIAPDLFRTDLAAPGYAFLDLDTGQMEPRYFRTLLVALGEALSREYLRRHGQPLHFHSISRFDQKAQTRPHRDGGPDASILLLGYEATAIRSRVSLIDYTRAAFDCGLTPEQFLDQRNPAFGGNAEALKDYTVELSAFRPEHFQIVIVNNSQVPFAERQRGMLGLLHHAVVEGGQDGARWIDSLLMGVSETGLSEEQLRAFVQEGTAATR